MTLMLIKVVSSSDVRFGMFSSCARSEVCKPNYSSE
jgi:hypothetical protein